MYNDSVTPDVATSTIQDVVKTEESSINAATFSTKKTGTFDIIDPIIRYPPTRIQKNHPIGNIIDGLIEGRKTRDSLRLNY